MTRDPEVSCAQRKFRASKIWLVLGVLAIVVQCSTAEAAENTPPAPVSVDAIVVTADRLSVETLIDRKVYSVASDVQSTFGSLSDILNVIPSVDVDPDGIVSLRGDSNVMILVDGKPSTEFSGTSAGDNLQSIPASDIERIEILTTPPAQFRAAGAAGVINIIMRKRREVGTSGSVQGSLGSGGRSVVGAEGGFSGGKLTASASASYRQDLRQRLTQSELITADPVNGMSATSNSSIVERIRREVPIVALAASYSFNDRQSISGSVHWTDRGGLRTYTELNDSSTPSGPVTSSTRRLSDGHDPETDYDQRLGFTQKLATAGETLDFSLHRSTAQQREHYDYTNDSFVPALSTFYNNLTFHEEREITAFDADYVLPLSRTRSVKLGYSFEQDNYRFGNFGNNVDPLTGVQTKDPNLTNEFEYRQPINAAYASYQASSGAWTWLSGFRAELTRTAAQVLTNNIANTGSYFRIYPSLHIDRSISDDSTLSFGASRRITRPDPNNLNPYIDYEYTPNLRAGNPNLRPQYTQSYEVGYSIDGGGVSHSLTGYYRLNKDSVTDLTEYLSNGLTLTTKVNLPKYNSAGVEFTSDGHILPKLAYSISGNLFYSQIDATALGTSGLQSTTGLNAKLKLDYRPNALDSAQVTATRTDKRLTPQGYMSAINIVNLGYRRQMMSDLTAVMSLFDVFNGQRIERFITAPTFSEEYRRTVRGRVFYIGCVYSFGAGKKGKQPNIEYDQSG